MKLIYLSRLDGVDACFDAGKCFWRHFDHSIFGQKESVRAVRIGWVRLTRSQLEHVRIRYVGFAASPIFGRARVYVCAVFFRFFN